MLDQDVLLFLAITNFLIARSSSQDSCDGKYAVVF